MHVRMQFLEGLAGESRDWLVLLVEVAEGQGTTHGVDFA
jgi:hypothetical protein